MKENANELRPEIYKLNIFSNIIWYCSFLFFNLGLLIWKPYIHLRKHFSYEIERLLDRIQILASKEEAAQLAILECKVTNEQSLHDFIREAKIIASKYGISEIVDKFDLWSA